MDRSPRNKTISLTDDEIKSYSSGALRITSPVTPDKLQNRTVLGDLFEVADKLPEGFVDLMIADPPYNLTKKFGENTFTQTSHSEYEDYTELWLSKVMHTLKPTATVYVCCDWYSSIAIGNVLARKFNIKNRITWQREKGRGSKTNWKNSSEDIWFCTLSDKYTFNPDAVKLRRKVLAPYKDNGTPKDWHENGDGKFRDTYASNFWDDISIPFWSMPENTPHPTQKPEKLIAKLILASTNENDFVFDPFMGSGTVPVTAKKLSRRFCGIELDNTYTALAERRLELANDDTRIQGFEDNIFRERNYPAPKHERNK